MNEKVITVKGKGRASAPHDWIKINMSLKAKNLTYKKTINLASKQLVQLRECLKEYGFDPDILPEKLLSLKLPEEVIKDIESGEYMFGRGVLDMKSGVAGHMYLIKYFSEHPEELDGNLIAIAECDEEDSSCFLLPL